MTHSDIKIKFLIEYDKMTTTSSYPSLTDYEMATVLDKAYLTVIANKLSGNNARKATFESDNKSIEDIRPLIRTKQLERDDYDPEKKKGTPEGSNKARYRLSQIEPKLMYYIQSFLATTHGRENVLLVSHTDSLRFEDTTINKPWIPQPVVYLEGDFAYVLYDGFKYGPDDIYQLFCIYITKPNLFVLDNEQVDFGDTEFELNDNVAQEVINTAIIMSAEIVESKRLSTKASISNIES